MDILGWEYNIYIEKLVKGFCVHGIFIDYKIDFPKPKYLTQFLVIELCLIKFLMVFFDIK